MTVAATWSGCARKQEQPTRSLSQETIPVQNPAFRRMPSPVPGHAVLFCFTAGDQPLGYEINPTAVRIWDACTSHTAFAAGRRKRLAEIGKELQGDVGEQEVVAFVCRLHAVGLVYSGSDQKIYFVRQERA